jgi:hypothetical protein
MLLNEYTNCGYPCCLDSVELECALDSLPVIASVFLEISSERRKNVYLFALVLFLIMEIVFTKAG